MDQKREDATTSDLMVKREWSTLPDDIFRRVIEQLYFVDRVRVRAVCKCWQVLATDVPSKDKLPWLMTYFQSMILYGVHDLKYTLVDPVHRKVYEAREQTGGRNFFKVCACRFVELPKLSTSGLQYGLATFSASPTSDDCNVFVLGQKPYKYKEENVVVINTCRLGDEAWRSTKLDELVCERVIDVAYGEGRFCCVFKRASLLGVYSVANNTWSLLGDASLRGSIMDELHSSSGKKHLIESNGEILLANHDIEEGWSVYRFDFSMERFVPKLSLGCRALFLGLNSFTVSTLEARGITDMVYYHQGSTPCSFSMKKSLLSTKKSAAVRQAHRRGAAGRNRMIGSSCSLSVVGDCGDEARLFDWYTTGLPDRIWIQPPY